MRYFMIAALSILGASTGFATMSQPDANAWTELELTDCVTSEGRKIELLTLEGVVSNFKVKEFLNGSILVLNPSTSDESKVYWNPYSQSKIVELHPHFLRLVGTLGTDGEFWLDTNIYEVFPNIQEDDKSSVFQILMIQTRSQHNGTEPRLPNYINQLSFTCQKKA